LQLLFAGQLRSYGEGEEWCDFDDFRRTSSGTEIDITCRNSINPDVSRGTLEITGALPNAFFRRYGRWWNEAPEPMTRCITLSGLMEHFGAAWQLDSSKCTATARIQTFDLIFARRDGARLDLILLDRSGSLDGKSALPLVVFADDMKPLEVDARLQPGVATVPLGDFAEMATILSESMFLSVWEQEMANKGSGTYRMPIFHVPLLGSTRAMAFLSNCR